MSNSNRSWKKVLSAAVAATVLATAMTGVARADDISNNLDGTIDSTAESMALNVGGVNKTTTLYVQTRNGDGKNGCNLTGSTSLVVNVASSNPSVVTVSPSSVTFTSCGYTQTLTVSPVGTGVATISLSQVSNNSGGTFDLAPATFVATVAAPSNTAPSISVNGVTAGANYEIGSVPAATCQVTDAEDGNSSFAATLSAITGPLAAFALGSQTASCSYIDAGGLTTSASKTYSIVDTGNPTITFVSKMPEANGNGWNNTNVIVEWSCSDTGSGVVAATVTQTVSTEGANQAVTGTCTDNAGNTASDTQYVSIDKTKPTASATALPVPNGNGWNNTDVTVSITGTDSLSGIDTCSDDAVLSNDGAGQSASGTCTDNAGNVSDPATASGINIDKTAPTLSGSPTTSPNGNGWYKSNVTIAWTCSDALSDIDGACPADSTISGEGAGLTANASVSDKAGNSTTATSSPSVNIDKTAPSVSLVGGPANGGSYYFGSVPAAPNCSASDALSGVDGICTVSGYSTTVGSHTVTASATDMAGNTGTASNSYTVNAWTLKGFYQPVDMNGVWNTVKAGSTVPLKFEVFAGPMELTDTTIIKLVGLAAVPCTATTEDAIELTATGGTSLRYDSVAGQFIFNWQTPKKPGSCYKVTMMTTDGSSITANFKLK